MNQAEELVKILNKSAQSCFHKTEDGSREEVDWLPVPYATLRVLREAHPLGYALK